MSESEPVGPPVSELTQQQKIDLVMSLLRTMRSDQPLSIRVAAAKSVNPVALNRADRRLVASLRRKKVV